MERNIDLTNGDILKTLTRLAVPIMGTSFVQMAYNLTDMFWVGKAGSDSVAAVGTAGFFTWFAMSLILLSKIGAEVFVAQNLGRRDAEGARSYAVSAVQLNIVLALGYGLLLVVFRGPLIAFFNLGAQNVIEMAMAYLMIVGAGMLFTFINPVFTGIFNGAGNSKTPFIINFVGLGLNMVLDPLLILGVGPFPEMGVVGAATATVVSQLVVTVIFIIIMGMEQELYYKINIFTRPQMDRIRLILKIGVPVALQSGLFSLIAMVIARIIAIYGPAAIAVQKVGSQIESLSWMTASGFSTAIGAFVGQNYGARKFDRIIKGYRSGLAVMSFIGILATVLLFAFAGPLFGIFIREPETLIMGIAYLQILALSQWFMTLEISTQGAFNGLGRTLYPSVVGIVFNLLRIPAAYYLSQYTSLGLNGIWWAISISSVFKGVILYGIFRVKVVRHYARYTEIQ